MSDPERIAALEARLALVEARMALLEVSRGPSLPEVQGPAGLLRWPFLPTVPAYEVGDFPCAFCGSLVCGGTHITCGVPG